MGAVAPARWPHTFPVDDIKKAPCWLPVGLSILCLPGAPLQADWYPKAIACAPAMDNEVVGCVRKQSLSSQEGPPTYLPSSFTPRAPARLEGFSQEGAGLHIWHVWVPQLLLITSF